MIHRDSHGNVIRRQRIVRGDQSLIGDVVDELGSRKEVESLRWILENGSGADRQLRAFQEADGDLRKVVDFICSETSHGIEGVPTPAAASKD